MRGINTLFGIFVEQDKAPKPEGYRERNFFKEDRDRQLSYRYYYYVEIQRWRYDDVLKQLEKEFHITEHRIVTVMSENQDTLVAIMKQKPTYKELTLLYPHLVWRAKQK
jgi:hypothetical protein